MAGNRIGVEGARALGDALKKNTTLTKLWLNGKQQDHNEAQQESKASTMACGVAGQATGLVMKERVHWAMPSRQAQH